MRSAIATLQEITIPMGAGPGTPSVYIGPRIPADLVAHYAAEGITLTMAIIASGRTGPSFYQVWGYVPGPGGLAYWMTGVFGLAIAEATRTYWDDGLAQIINGAFIDAGTISASQLVALTGPFTIDAVSQPRGVLPGGYVSSTAAAGPVGTSFTPVLTQSSTGTAITFRGGRVYAVHVGGGGLSTSATTNVMEVRVNWFPGGVAAGMFDAGAFGPEYGAPSRQNVYNVNYFGFTSDVTPTDVVVYAKASAGTVTWYGDYSGNNRGPRFLMIEDKGAVASFPGVTMLN